MKMVGTAFNQVAQSDSTIHAGTGRTWDEWLAALDAWDEDNKSFVRVMKFLSKQHGLNRRWAQVVAVYYYLYLEHLQAS
jgi:hypothetical protein